MEAGIGQCTTYSLLLRTVRAEVVDENDLLDELVRGPVEHTVHSAQQRRPSLVVETDDDARCWETAVRQCACVVTQQTPEKAGN